MLEKGNLRRYKRRPFISPFEYSVSDSNLQKLDRARDIVLSVDISAGGIGIITESPLDRGFVLTFQEEIQIGEGIFKKAAVVRWQGKIDSKYRVGLEFI